MGGLLFIFNFTNCSAPCLFSFPSHQDGRKMKAATYPSCQIAEDCFFNCIALYMVILVNRLSLTCICLCLRYRESTPVIASSIRRTLHRLLESTVPIQPIRWLKVLANTIFLGQVTLSSDLKSSARNDIPPASSEVCSSQTRAELY